MNLTENSPSSNRRGRLHALFAAVTPTSLVMTWRQALLATGFFFAGTVFIFLAPMFFGRLLWRDPDAVPPIYSLCGLPANVITGIVLAVITRRQMDSSHLSRLVFWSFTAPAMIAVACLALILVEYLLGQALFYH